MLTHLKAFIVVFVISIVVLVFFRKPFADAVGGKRFDAWRNLWIAMVICLFLVPSFWLFIVISGALVFALSRSEPIKPAIFMMLLFAAPALGDAIPGFAGINKFIMVTPQSVTTAILLLPAMFIAKNMKKTSRIGNGADMFFLLWLMLQIALCLRGPTFTHIVRTMIESFLVMAPFYYVFSRYPKSLDDIRVISAAYLAPILVLSVVSIAEVVRNWHFYTGVSTYWFGELPFSYTMRDGVLRASASVFDPIVWGLVAMTGIGVGLALFNEKFSRLYKFAGFILLTAGMITSLSRGPWVGALALIIVFVITGPKASARAAQLGAASVMASLMAMATPFGQKLLDLLPFIGTTASDTITYRQRLWDVSLGVIAENPFLGSPNFQQNPEMETLRQGQGIIDVVNSYLFIALQSGLIGLGLFLGVFAYALIALRRAMKSAKIYDPEFALYCRAYFATIIGILITIFTTSSVFHTPIIYWSFAGLAIALARIEQTRKAAHEAGQSLGPEKVAATREHFDWK